MVFTFNASYSSVCCGGSQYRTTLEDFFQWYIPSLEILTLLMASPPPSTSRGMNGISLIYMCKVTHLFHYLEVNSKFWGKNEGAHFKQCHSPWVTPWMFKEDHKDKTEGRRVRIRLRDSKDLFLWVYHQASCLPVVLNRILQSTSVSGTVLGGGWMTVSLPCPQGISGLLSVIRLHLPPFILSQAQCCCTRAMNY